MKKGVWILIFGLVLALPCLYAQDDHDSASSAEPEVQLVEEPPTIPYVPPVLPSFYNDPVFVESGDFKGRSLSAALALCGDSVYDPGEECDDGNTQDLDGCSSTCDLENPEACGNGHKDPGETCDDGNLADGDGCSATCQQEGVCGDGVIDPPFEECDDGNGTAGDGCTAKCKSESIIIDEPPVDLAVCGNGVTETGEGCDDGNLTSGDGCSISCQPEDDEPVDEPEESVCGDGQTGEGEQCDDGNSRSGDGCSSSCTIEYGDPPQGKPVCGNGIVEEGEGCDDGNRYSHDGCSHGCEIEDDVIVDQPPRVEYRPGNPTVDPTLCQGACTMKIVTAADGTRISAEWIRSEDSVSGSYPLPGVGEVDCESGHVEKFGQGQASQNVEATNFAQAGRITNCTA